MAHTYVLESELLGNNYFKAQQMALMYWLVNKAAIGKNDLDWRRFEELLGCLDYESVIRQYKDKDEAAKSICETVGRIGGYFIDWINTIDIQTVSPIDDFSKLIKPDKDFAISFNYTETLEEVYKMEPSKVLHVHGRRETDIMQLKYMETSGFGKNNEQLIVGYKAPETESTRFNGWGDKIKYNLMQADDFLQKKVEDIIKSKKDYWDELENGNIDKVYSIGFSFSDVDLPYIKKICEILNKNQDPQKIVWFLSSYNYEENEENYKKRIIEAGFKGSFSKCIGM